MINFQYICILICQNSTLFKHQSQHQLQCQCHCQYQRLFQRHLQRLFKHLCSITILTIITRLNILICNFQAKYPCIR